MWPPHVAPHVAVLVGTEGDNKPFLRQSYLHHILLAYENRIYRDFDSQLSDRSTWLGCQGNGLAADHLAVVGTGEAQISVVRLDVEFSTY